MQILIGLTTKDYNILWLHHMVNFRYILIISISFILLSNTFLNAQEKTKRPNILWITCEDMSANLPMYGDSTVKTPYLSKFAEQAVKYTKMYAVAGVCAPSRSGIITGMYPPAIGTQHMRTGTGNEKDPSIPSYMAVTPTEVKAFPEYLRAAGYYCTNNQKTDYQIGEPFTVWDDCSKDAHWRNRPKDKPFFAVFNINETHESMIWKNANRPLRVDPKAIKLPPYYPESDIIRRDIARYYDNIMLMDSIAGNILKQLEDDGLAENTIVFFFSDHGAALPWYKREVYERGLHVPFMVRFPDGKLANITDNQLLSFMDLAPTVLSLANIQLPEHFNGQAFLGNQKAESPRRYIFAARDRLDEHYDLVRTVRDSKFQYIRNYQPEKLNYMDVGFRKQMPLMVEILKLRDQQKLDSIQNRWFKSKSVEELYDVENDPFELNNLAQNPAYAAKLQELRDVQNNWSLQIKDKGFMSEKDMVRLMWPGGIQPVTAKPVAQITTQNRSILVSLSSSTNGASLGYKIGDNGSWQLYHQPVAVKKGIKVYAKAIRYGYKESEEIMISTN
ncbi:sulfatase family protein [Pedobacter glucosidilyticus]|uniref:sulfatase family protein n=1 Tax=Pedobacter glucosidilyticus TaxID=1122941 RepID=UPI001B7FD880|nr:sulfatase [Pedobacter glucosidilyticus]